MWTRENTSTRWRGWTLDPSFWQQPARELSGFVELSLAPPGTAQADFHQPTTRQSRQYGANCLPSYLLGLVFPCLCSRWVICLLVSVCSFFRFFLRLRCVVLQCWTCTGCVEGMASFKTNSLNSSDTQAPRYICQTSLCDYLNMYRRPYMLYCSL